MSSSVEGRAEEFTRERIPLPEYFVQPTNSTSKTKKAGTINIIAVAREDSDLEAFSHNPTDGSFAPLIGRSST
jgi:hypothetical protein